MQSHHKAAASVIAEALEAAKRSVAVKSGKLKEAETKPLESSLPAGNGWFQAFEERILNCPSKTPPCFLGLERRYAVFSFIGFLVSVEACQICVTMRFIIAGLDTLDTERQVMHVQIVAIQNC